MNETTNTEATMNYTDIENARRAAVKADSTVGREDYEGAMWEAQWYFKRWTGRRANDAELAEMDYQLNDAAAELDDDKWNHWK